MDSGELSDQQVADVVASCHGYFAPDRNPYMAYFGFFERFMQAAGIGSYLDGSACHLDLVQWATDPVWGELNPPTRARLVEDDAKFLAWQLTHENIRVVLCNGRSVVDAVNDAGIAAMEQVGTLIYGPGGHSTVKVYVGQARGVLFLGWNMSLHKALAGEARDSLAAWVAEEMTNLDEPPVDSVPPRATPEPSGDGARDVEDGFIRVGTTVRSTGDLAELLQRWATQSDRSTIGDVGHFSGRAWVRLELGTGLVVLNADTKRSAVLDYLAHTSRHGHETPPLRVQANRKGIINKVAYRENRLTSPGWYAYLVPPASAPREL